MATAKNISIMRKGFWGVELNELSIAGKLLAGVFAVVIALSAFTMVSLLIQRNGV
ncbi:hypothetical protein [Alteromonas sp. KUL49]|uniref:hypothetical protein n=1 Tax=Alteromonas sp. KUL49 TaxID=2480798 RepID=UPI0010FFC51E|nr:hypothetical protein [Alteromonas sp. KUL49]GEA13118.1 hypothetical protein KUL49_34930 [Alteromonas sp. KUL49]